MSSQELYDNFLLQYDVNGSSAAAGFTDEEIYMFLTQGQLVVLDQLTATGESEIIEELLTTEHFNTQEALSPYTAPNIKIAIQDQPNDIYKVVTGSVNVTRNGILKTKNGPTAAKLKQIDIAFVGNLMESDFNKPIFEWVYYFLHEGNLFIIHDSYVESIYHVGVTYLRMPNDITASITAELKERFHKEIVNSAVHIALTAVGDARIKKG